MTQFMTAAPPEAVRVMPDGRKVTAIPARMQACAAVPLQPVRKPRVAAYARVSTDSEEQLTSYEAQVDYYTKKIRENPDWTFVEVYADEGISGTNTKKPPPPVGRALTGSSRMRWLGRSTGSLQKASAVSPGTRWTA